MRRDQGGACPISANVTNDDQVGACPARTLYDFARSFVAGYGRRLCPRPGRAPPLKFALLGQAPPWFPTYLCYNMLMDLSNIQQVVMALRQRLEPVERADSLRDTLEGQRPNARKGAFLIGLLER